MDRFYTPPDLAERMVGSVTLRRVESIADFSAGEGELLKAAAKRWPGAKIFANDISRGHAMSLKRAFPSWTVRIRDFTKFALTGSVGPFDELESGASLVLLNPPFSRSNGRPTVFLNDESFTASYGLSFAIIALRFLRSDGQLLAILPAGTITNQSDREAWDHVRCGYTVEILEQNGNNVFKGCSPETVIVRMTPRDRPVSKRKRGVALTGDSPSIELFRGRVPVSGALNGTAKTYPYVHSTDLKRFQLQMSSNRVRTSYKSISGPAVLLPRVGKPNVEKTILYLSNKRIVLSDCVIAVRCADQNDAERVFEMIVKRWPLFEGLYRGTCAKFITLESIREFLQKYGCLG